MSYFLRYLPACLALFAVTVQAEVTLTAPAEVPAGAWVFVDVAGETDKRDFVTIVTADTPEGEYKNYKYVQSKTRLKLRAPEDAGDYEIRYLSNARPYPTLARHTLTITPVTGTVQAPSQVDAGAKFEVTWTGPDNPQDFIALSKPDGSKKERRWIKYVYTKSGSPAKLTAPDEPGTYEIRYRTGVKYYTLATATVVVTGTTATVDAPATVQAGAKFEVIWTGPDNAQDFISLRDLEGSEKERRWIKYVYTKKGSPAKLTAPDEPGTYEIAYRTGAKYYTLAATNIVVTGNTAALDAPASVQAGARFKVDWTGPDNQQDYIAISPAGTDERTYHHYRYTRQGATVTLNAPDVPGEYEVRYQTGQTNTILAREAITIEPVTATVDAPDTVVGGEDFTASWTGPDNRGDYIGIYLAGADRRASAKGQWAYTHYGSQAQLRAPLEPGDYEVRYQTGQSGAILATRALRVTPPPVLPGRLQVSIDPSVSAFGDNDAVEIILDASGSMLKKQGGKRRIEIAREVLLGLTGEVIPAGTPFALRVFGHKEADSCRTDLEESLAPLDVARVDAKLKTLQAKNLAKTPIARSLELVAKDLKTVTGERIVVLVTDGEETCDGDPAAVIEALKQNGIDVRVNIVGFAIDDADLKARFRYWADLGGGDYHDAASAAGLEQSMTAVLQAPYDVLDAAGAVVASGMVGDDGVDLPPGSYTVRTRTTPPREGAADVIADKETGVVLK